MHLQEKSLPQRLKQGFFVMHRLLPLQQFGLGRHQTSHRLTIVDRNDINSGWQIPSIEDPIFTDEVFLYLNLNLLWFLRLYYRYFLSALSALS